MRFTEIHLLEAIDASGIDRKARVLLQDALTKHIEKEWVDFLHTQQPQGDVHDQYDAFFQFWNGEEPVGSPGTISRRWAFTRRICDVASRCLSQLVQQHLVQSEFGNREKRSVKLGGKVASSGILVPVENFKVKVEDKSDSADRAKETARGYFRPDITNSLIKVFVDRDDIFSAGMGLAQVVVMGEGEGYDELADRIGSTFTHEYVHMEQFIRGDFSGDSDWGYITAGGGRRGNRRTPEKDLVHWLRYRGSASEIEAFAQQAASEMIKEAGRYRRSYTDAISDDVITAVLQDLATGYASATHMRSYQAIGWDEFAEECEKLGVKRHEMITTWRRFMKLTYRAVLNYREKRMGRAHHGNWHIKDAPTTWRESLEQGRKMSATAQMIAREIVDEMLANHMADLYDGEKMVQHSQAVDKAVNFLHTAYFARDDYDDSQWSAVSASFRRMVARLFDAEKRKLQMAA